MAHRRVYMPMNDPCFPCKPPRSSQPTRTFSTRDCRYDPAERLTAEAALAHDYFEPLRRMFAREEAEERRRRLYPFLPPAMSAKGGVE